MIRNRILVIDDNTVNRCKIKQMLPPDSPYKLLEAKNGQQGLSLLAQEHSKLNLIILDFLVSQVSGWKVLQNIQANQNLNRIPLVLMSRNKAEVIAKIPLPFTDFAFLPQPFDKRQLEEAVSTAITQVGQRRWSKETLPQLGPRKNDLVLGSRHTITVGSLVLGGIEGLKIRLNSANPNQRVAALRQASQYGEAGKKLLRESLKQ